MCLFRRFNQQASAPTSRAVLHPGKGFFVLVLFLQRILSEEHIVVGVVFFAVFLFLLVFEAPSVIF